MSSNTPFIVGIDGGGTQCRATLFDPNGTPIARAKSGPANVARDFSTAKNSIIDAVSLVLSRNGENNHSPLDHVAVFAGLAGAQVQSAKQQIDDWQHPFASFQSVTDLHASTIGAHEGRNGAVLIVGTGSCAAALTNGSLRQFGGHGFLLGDKGSGAWLGLSAVKKTLIALDGVGTKVDSTFTLPILNALKVESTYEIVSLMSNQNPAFFATLAPLVIELAEADQQTAKNIIKKGAKYLSAIATQAIEHSNGNICLMGGVSQRIRPWLDNQVQAAIVEPLHSAEWGAVLAAR